MITNIPHLTPNHYTILSFQFSYAEEMEMHGFRSILQMISKRSGIQTSHSSHTRTREAFYDVSVDYFDSSTNIDGSRSYFVDITNNGTESIPLLFVDLYFDQENQPELGTDGDEYVTIEEIYPGETKWADFLISDPCSPCRSWVMVDSLDFIVESDESNNIGGPLSP